MSSRVDRVGRGLRQIERPDVGAPATTSRRAVEQVPGIRRLDGRTPATRRATSHVKRISLLLLVVDVIALLVSSLSVGLGTPFMVLLVAGVLSIFKGSGLYRSRLTLSIADDAPAVAGGVVGSVAVTGLVGASFTGIGAAEMVLLACISFALLVLGRATAYELVRAARRSGWATHRTLIVGTGPTAERVARTLREHPEHGLRVVGFLGPRLQLARSVEPDSIIAASAADLGRVAAEHDVGVVIVTHVGDAVGPMLKELRNRHHRDPYTLFLVPPLFHLMHSRRGERIRDVALIRLEPRVVTLVAGRVKRLFDIAFALTALVVLSPVMALTALAVRLEIGPPILFRQTRVGLGGRCFTLYKFSSLLPDDDAEGATTWSVGQDRRIGPVGRFIRRTSLDELPQLVNIVRGDMSLVGPRPERPYFVEQFEYLYDGYPLRHRVRPGLTGWAAVNGLRGDTSIEERAYFDNVYIDNWSLWQDVKIIGMTVAAVFGGRGQ